MTNTITNFAILGERCSGTNFLEETICANFNINYTTEFGHKHFFCFNDYSNKQKTDNTLFIGIIRNPIYWLNSFSKELYHVPEINKKSLNNFLFNEFYSVHNETNPKQENSNVFLMGSLKYYVKKYNVNEDDNNYLTGKKYKNIFELRNVKNNFLLNVMPKKVKNYILINYEDLLFNFEITMQTIKDKFNLISKLNSFEKVKKYKKCETYHFVKQREITFTPKVVNVIWKNLNLSQEKMLGYYPYNNNEFFKLKYATK